MLVDKNHICINAPIPRTDPKNVEPELVTKLHSVIKRNKMEVVAATQIGYLQNLILGRLDNDVIECMINPRIIELEDDYYYHRTLPGIHSNLSFTCRYKYSIMVEWDKWGIETFTSSKEMYGEPAALYQQAIRFLEGHPPWSYNKLIDW